MQARNGNLSTLSLVVWVFIPALHPPLCVHDVSQLTWCAYVHWVCDCAIQCSQTPVFVQTMPYHQRSRRHMRGWRPAVTPLKEMQDVGILHDRTEVERKTLTTTLNLVLNFNYH